MDNLTEIAGAIIGAMALVAGFVLKQKGLITFGKPVERRNCVKRCDEHSEVIKDAALVSQRVETLKERQITVLEKVTAIEHNVAKIDHCLAELVGYLRAHRNNRDNL